jgi:hypothetical protein
MQPALQVAEPPPMSNYQLGVVRNDHLGDIGVN